MEQDKEKLPVIRLGQENAPVLMDLQKNDEGSLFSSVYDEAYSKIKEYIKAVKERESLYNKNKNNPLYRNENYNNIFAFCGERGSGKTSCMQTVAYNINFRLKDNKDKFEILDIIDPSFFDSTHNILELVISQLFKEFAKKLGQYSCHCNNQDSIQNKKRVLIKQFQIVKENITNLEAKCDPDETIESLAKLSASMDLGKSIFDLVDKYLEFCDNSGFLVIQIDDIDLNTEHAYKMIEQIRKYLIQSNIIILMAAKLEQLNDVVKLDYQIKFEKLIQAKMMNGNIGDYAQKYLLKLIPEDKRIDLPTIKYYYNDDILIQSNNKCKQSSLNAYQQEEIEKILLFVDKLILDELRPGTLRELLNRLSIYNSLNIRKERFKEKRSRVVDLNKKYYCNDEEMIVNRFMEYYFQSIAPIKNSFDRINLLKKIFLSNEMSLLLVVRDVLEEELGDIYIEGTINGDDGNIIDANRFYFQEAVGINQIIDIVNFTFHRFGQSKSSEFITSVLFVFNIRLNMIHRKIRLSILGNRIMTVNKLAIPNLPSKQAIDEYYDILSSENRYERILERTSELKDEINQLNQYRSKYENDEFNSNWQFMYQIENEKRSKLIEENTNLRSKIFLKFKDFINVAYERFDVEELLTENQDLDNVDDILRYIENKKLISNYNDSLERLKNEYFHRARRFQDTKQIESIEFLKKQIEEKRSKIRILENLSFAEMENEDNISRYKILISLLKECYTSTTDNKSYVFNPISLFNNNEFVRILNTSNSLLDNIITLTNKSHEYIKSGLSIEYMLVNVLRTITDSIDNYFTQNLDYESDIKHKKEIAEILYGTMSNDYELMIDENIGLFNFYNSLFIKN